jgi:hypothetical protein
MKTTIAITTKLIHSAKNGPIPRLTGPKARVAVFQSPDITKAPINGMILLSINEFTRAVAGAPIRHATARGTTGHSFKIQEILKSFRSC